MSTSRRPETEDDLLAAARSIVSTLRQVESGDLTATVELPYSGDEPLARLAERLNAAVRALAARRQETAGYQLEIETQINTIEQQQVAIRELSTPIIEAWAGVLCVPIVGVLDSSRAAELTSSLLNSVVSRKAAYAIIDITGIEAMDTQATDHFIRMGRAVKLLGSECVLSGVNSAVAQTITHMGLDLGGISVFRTLGTALAHYVKVSRSRRQRPRRTASPGASR